MAANAPPGTQAIIGESALTGGGGADGTTNAFVSSLWYADWLGFAAKNKVSAVFRETLMGGYYEIVNKSSYLPNPDAYLVRPRTMSYSCSAPAHPGPFFI
eukprot:SAG22_NODE_613_length_8567_cov_4.215163_7_plen_100_part_00